MNGRNLISLLFLECAAKAATTAHTHTQTQTYKSEAPLGISPDQYSPN